MKIRKTIFVVFSTILLLAPTMIYAEGEELDPTPSPSTTPSETPTPKPSPTPTPTIEESPDPTPTSKPTPEPSTTPSETPTPKPSPTPSEQPKPDKIDISLNKKTIELTEEETFTLEVTITPSTNSEKPKWKSSDENIVSVNNGKITARKKGTATITVMVGDEKETCKVTVLEREKSKDATLSKLVISNGTMSPQFAKDVYEYEVTIAEDVSSLVIGEYKLSDSHASYFGLSSSKNKNLKNGTVLELKVVAEAGNEQIYKLKIIKEGINSLALKKLEISGYALNEVFHPETLNYTADIPNVVDKITITATPQDSTSTISTRGTANLQVGENTVKVTVKDEAGNSRVYTIIVTRDKEQKIEENPTSIITSQITGNPNENTTPDNQPSKAPFVTPPNPDSFLKYFIVSFACFILITIGGIGIYFFIKTSPKKNRNNKKKMTGSQDLEKSSPMVEVTQEKEMEKKANIELFETKEFQIDDLSSEVLDNIYDDKEDV